MTVHFIGAGPGDPELITVRGLRLIRSCPVCLYAGSLVPEAVVSAAPADARVLDTAPMTLDEIIGEFERAHVLGDGDLVCFDSDAVGAGGYSVDFSRTFACGPQDPSARQLELHRIAGRKAEIGLPELLLGERHCGCVDVDTDDLAEKICQVVVNDAA